MKKQSKIAKNKGFSLVEVVIAIGIVAVLLTTFMAVFAPAQRNISRALGLADASRLVSTLENELAVLHDGEENDYQSGGNTATAFDKAFEWIKESSDRKSAVIVYQYQAIPKQLNRDDSMKAATSADVANDAKLPGVDYITQTVARRVDNDNINSELAPGVIVGNVYVVKMTQLIKDSSTDGLKLSGNPKEIQSLDGNVAQDSSSYEDSYIAFQAEFYQLNNNLAGYVKNGSWSMDKLGAPVATQNIAVRR